MQRKAKRKRHRHSFDSPQVDLNERFEVETIFGLEPYVAREITAKCRGARVTRGGRRPGRVSVAFENAPASLYGLRSAVAVHKVLSFPVTRPAGLLGEERLGNIAAEARRIIGKSDRGVFKTLSISAAGKDSSVFQRLTSELSERLGLSSSDDRGDLAISVRPAPGAVERWDVLIRLTPRPLSARHWRVCDMPGALDATVAHVMSAATAPSERQRFLNIACGSSTLLIERLAMGPARRAVGVDIDPAALECGERNVAAAKKFDQVELLKADATTLPFRDNSFEAIVGDLPFGMLMRREEDGEKFYADILSEAARVGVPGAVLALITTDHSRMEAAFAASGGRWELAKTIDLRLPSNRGYISPAVYIAGRTDVG